MALSRGQVDSLARVGISKMLGDSVFKNHAYLSRLEKKKKKWDGTKYQVPFNYFGRSQTTGKFYVGAENLEGTIYDPFTSMQFELKEIEETITIAMRDIALTSGDSGVINLLESRLKFAEKAMRERMTSGIFSDGTAATGEATTAQFVGQAAFLLSSSVNYGGVTSSDVSTHVAYVSSNGGTNRALTTALIQTVFGGSAEGEEKVSLAIQRQGVMNSLQELLKPHQRTTRESSLDNLGHKGSILVYNGVDFIVDNLSLANAISFINEDHVHLIYHPDFNMKNEEFSKLEDSDARRNRISWKGAYVCDTLRYQGKLADITET